MIPLPQVLSGIFTLAVLGGLGYWWLTKDNAGGGQNMFELPTCAPCRHSSTSVMPELTIPAVQLQRRQTPVVACSVVMALWASPHLMPRFILLLHVVHRR
jgi:hypothetical protein